VTHTPEPEPSFDAFLSYHSGDADWVETLKTALESKGIRVWIDSEQIRPGDLFPGALARAIGSVRCVVLVLSPGSVASAWVEEEFNLALARRCRVIPTLIDDVEPPGFIQGRSWVDFRDSEQFAAGLDQVVFGIRGDRPPDAAHAAAPAYRDAPPSATSADESYVLQRLIERRRQDVRRLWRARVASTLAGLGIGGAFAIVGSDASVWTRLAVAILAPSILGLAAWGLTTTGLTRLDSKVEQFELLRDGLEACRSRSHPGCRKLRQRFWDMMTDVAGDVGARPASGTLA
jgi:hypothetical protein